jgi:hypothetical protein
LLATGVARVGALLFDAFLLGCEFGAVEGSENFGFLKFIVQKEKKILHF